MSRDHHLQGGTKDAGYEVWLELERRLLRVHVWGVWDDVLAHQFATNSGSRAELLGPEPYSGITDIRDAPIQTPVVKAIRGAAAARAVRAGLSCVALVSADVLSSWQIQRMLREAGCKEVACFTTEWEALAWLQRRQRGEDG